MRDDRNGEYMEVRLEALTPIWTGGVDGKRDRLHETGIMGSLRWWFEVLVRGFGERACDATSEASCPDKNKEPSEHGHHCVVCELFGCTGWARKFRLMILDENGEEAIKQIGQNQKFTLRFIPLRPIRDEEWCLLEMTLRLIADYGAMGGKTVFKPSNEPGRQNAFHHQDFGIVEYPDNDSALAKHCKDIADKRSDLKEWLTDYVSGPKWRKPAYFSWASLENFWCVEGKYLERIDYNKSTFNRVIGRPEKKNQSKDNDSWLAGFRANSKQKQRAVSKKVFSFKVPDGGRTFGFVKPDRVDFEEIKRRLGEGFAEKKFLQGKDILDELLTKLNKGGQS